KTLQFQRGLLGCRKPARDCPGMVRSGSKVVRMALVRCAIVGASTRVCKGVHTPETRTNVEDYIGDATYTTPWLWQSVVGRTGRCRGVLPMRIYVSPFFDDLTR